MWALRGASALLPPWQPIRIGLACPNCNEAFYSRARTPDFQDFFALLTAMPRLDQGSKLEIRSGRDRRAELSANLRYNLQNQWVAMVNAFPGGGRPISQRGANVRPFTRSTDGK